MVPTPIARGSRRVRVSAAVKQPHAQPVKETHRRVVLGSLKASARAQDDELTTIRGYVQAQCAVARSGR